LMQAPRKKEKIKIRRKKVLSNYIK